MGGASGAGGTSGAAGTTGSGPVFGMSCTTNQDCPSGSTCCNGSSEGCDGTRLPAGDGTNPGELLVSSDGLTVTDTITGLVWQADGSGTRASCTTDSAHLTCTQAEAEAYCSGLSLDGSSDWRLPAEHELHTLVDLTQYDPAIDGTKLPNTAAASHWTSSPYALASGQAWVVDFEYGGSSSDTVGSLHNVRCVRGSRCYPTSRFVVSGGFVTDTLTNLGWQQQSSPGDTPLVDWAAAGWYCSDAGSGLRSPTLKELESLVDLTVASPPTINQTVFPNTRVDSYYWTSSPSASSYGGVDAGYSGDAWYVNFDSGSSNFDWVEVDITVRCVR